jgi:hypothetical protein
LAHQWFGNKITCGSWEDIWLNEGFATYLSGLCYERIQPQYWKQFKQQRINSATSQAGGSVFVNDTTNVGRIFSGRLSYAKGAMVLHMLRWINGDSLFFQGVRNYLNDPALAYGYAKTADLKRHLSTTSGKNLDGFFEDWFTGQGYPSYKINWYPLANNQLMIQVKQTQSHPSVPYFKLPLPLRLKGPQGQVKDIVLNHTFDGQNFSIQAPFSVNAIEFDPDYWLITKDNLVEKTAVGTYDLRTLGFDMRIEPNPVSGNRLQALLTTPATGNLSYFLLSPDGRQIASGLQTVAPGDNRISFDISGFPAGIYLLKIQNEAGEMTSRAVLGLPVFRF